MQERVILYSDLNNFFASVEIALHPEYAGKPLIVCGDPKERHGIVLAKNEEAKVYGIKTAETVYSALKKCPQLLRVPSHFHEYKKYSRLVKEIYLRYTEKVEECSIDECALDVTESVALFGCGEEIAERIRKEVKSELGLTVSIGVSFNKVFSKIASDMKKPDAVTVITRENFKEKLFHLPVGDMLFVGGATQKTLLSMGIKTIGDLANAEEELLQKRLGKRGKQLSVFARGEDNEPVKWQKTEKDLISVGNSITLPKDVIPREEVKRWIYALSESVASRMRDAGVGKASTVHVVVRDDALKFFSWQTKILATSLCEDIAKSAYELFCKHYPLGAKVRLIGVTTSGFDYKVEQLSIDALTDNDAHAKKEKVENAVAKIREKYGYAKLQRGVFLEDEKLNGLDIQGKKEER